MIPPLDLTDLQDAARLLQGVTTRTPVEESTSLSAVAGVPVHLKCENLQRTGSFKLRGAYVRLSRLSPGEKARGVVAASAGNHAQGVALAARELGVSALVYMPRNAALPKLAATRGYGAQVRQEGATLAETLVAAQREAAATGRVLIPPFDHADVVAGQATLGLEILEQVPDVRTILVPTGGGGLLAGVAAAVHATGADVRVVGVQAEGAAAFPASLAAGHPVALTRMRTIADGIAVPAPGELTLGIVRAHVDAVLTVSEEQIARAMLLLAERAKLVVEPSGAAGVATLLDGAGALEGPVVVVLSGGNVDPLVLQRILRHGLVAAGRYLRMKVRVPDEPGSLAGLLAVLATTGANVVSVQHDRTGTGLGLAEVLIGVELETKGTDHCDEVVARLHAEGYGVVFRSVG
ncbi:threonine ammonia-lyase [Georgenia sp. 311]|uniref:threonine ammonia-lyase n=1 Tax=Georgenia sp. 311 TaxID=2585134 RepID=UPI0011124FD8|nr:threonine ammonia-lyase [Georgenia sp. 311]TNC18489.1 threonine ammonia-lyase [Georgenia sp. 311]